MSNCEVFQLPPIEAEPHQIREILKCLIHAVLFTRALGYVKPKDVDSDLLDITYVAVSDPDIHAAVESHISELCSQVERRPPSDVVQVTLSFYERRQRQAWFGAKDERLYWEQWVMPLLLIMPASGTVTRTTSSSGGARTAPAVQPLDSQLSAQQQSERLRESLEAALSHITRCVSDRRDHIPPVTSSATLTFPFEINATWGGSRSSLSLSNVKRALLQASPPPMLG